MWNHLTAAQKSPVTTNTRHASEYITSSGDQVIIDSFKCLRPRVLQNSGHIRHLLVGFVEKAVGLFLAGL